MTIPADVMGRSMLLLVKQADEAISQRDELLAAIKPLLDYRERTYYGRPGADPSIEAAKAAIAKAEGQ